MSNVRSIITSHNTRIIRKSQPQDISAENFNCRNKHACPLQNKCMSKDIVYKATIFTGNTQDTKHYIGMTSNTFKERYRNHIKSFTHKKYSNETECVLLLTFVSYLFVFILCELRRVSYQYQRNTLVPTRSIMLTAMTSASLQRRNRSKKRNIFTLEDRNK